MTQKDENKKILNESNFIKNSNASNPLLDNIFKIKFDVADSKLTDIIGNFGINKYVDMWDILEKNAHSVTVSTLETEYSVQYISNDRRYNVIKRLDSNILITFIESDDLIIRRIIDKWLDLTLSTNKEGLYQEEVSVDLFVDPISTDYETKQRMKYNEIFPINYADITLNLGGDAELKAINVIFNFVSNEMIS
jgi:hypothetical protein